MEIGCNIGGNLEWIINYFPNVKKYACDINQVEQAQKLFPEFEIKESSICGLPYEDKSIDILIVDMVLYLFSDMDIEVAIGECKRVAKKAIIISDMNQERFNNYIKKNNDLEVIDWRKGIPDLEPDNRFVFTILL